MGEWGKNILSYVDARTTKSMNSPSESIGHSWQTTESMRSSQKKIPQFASSVNWANYWTWTLLCMLLAGCGLKAPAPVVASFHTTSPASATVSLTDAIVETLGVRYVWTIPSDTSYQVNNIDVLACYTTVNANGGWVVKLDGSDFSIRPGDAIPRYESGVVTWKWRYGYMLRVTITDARLDTGWHMMEITIRDTAGNSNTRPFHIHLGRSENEYLTYLRVDTMRVRDGWNMVSPVGSYYVLAARIETDPPGSIKSPFYEFNGSVYTRADTLRPGGGYWVKVDRDCGLIFNYIHDLASLKWPDNTEKQMTTASSINEYQTWKLR